MKKLSTFLIATIAIGALGYLGVAKISPTAKADEAGAAQGQPARSRSRPPTGETRRMLRKDVDAATT